MERRLAQTSAVSAAATLAFASLAIAAISGGIFVAAASPAQPGVKTVEMVDDYIVVHPTPVATSTTLASVGVAASEAIVTSTVATVEAIAPASVAVSAAPAPLVETTIDRDPALPASPAAGPSGDDVTRADGHEDGPDDSEAAARSDDNRRDDGADDRSGAEEEEPHESDD